MKYTAKTIDNSSRAIKLLMQFKKDDDDSFDLLRQLVQEINAWDSSLEYLEAYEFDEDFFDTFFAGKVIEAVRATFFGDIQNWSDEYIRFNGYGNLESLSEYAYERELQDSKEEIIDRAIELISDGSIDPECVPGLYEMLED